MTSDELTNWPAHNVLTARPQWVCWRYDPRPNGKPKKPPVSAQTGRLCDVSDPASWATYRAALERQMEHDLPGVGYCLSDDDGIVGVDLDNVRDESGALSAEANATALLLDSYAEWSPSGNGLHVLVKATMPGPSVHVGDVEIYGGRGHYLTYTGDFLDMRRWCHIQERSSQLATLYDALQQGRARGGEGRGGAPVAALDDLTIIEMMLKSAIGPKAKALLLGDVSGYPSPSEADFRWCLYAAFYTDDAQQIDRLAHMTALPHVVDGHWDRERRSGSYGAITIAKALATQRNRYNPTWRPTS